MHGQSIYKFVIIGESSVGKSCIVMRYVDNDFTESFLTTVGVDFKVKNLELDGKKIKLQVWDTAGQEQFHTITRSYFRGASGILLVYDVTKKETYEQTRMWMDSIHETTGNASVILLANKIDLQDRKISKEEGEALAKEFNCPYFETSAKTGENIDEAFLTLARIVKEKKEKEPTQDSQTLKVTSDPNSNSSSKSQCC